MTYKYAFPNSIFYIYNNIGFTIIILPCFRSFRRWWGRRLFPLPQQQMQGYRQSGLIKKYFNIELFREIYQKVEISILYISRLCFVFLDIWFQIIFLDFLSSVSWEVSVLDDWKSVVRTRTMSNINDQKLWFELSYCLLSTNEVWNNIFFIRWLSDFH